MPNLISRPSPGWTTLPVLAIVLLAPMGSLVDAAWVEHSEVLYAATLGALIVGYVASRVRPPQLLAHLVGVGGGLAISVYAVGQTLPPVPDGGSQVAEIGRAHV